MWREYFKQKYLIVDGTLIMSAEYLDQGLCFSYPVGNGDFDSALKFLKGYCKGNGLALKFCCVTDEGVVRLSERLGQACEKIEYRDWADYLYPYSNFLGYHGKKLVTQRNHCNRFLRDHPQYEYMPIDEKTLPAAKAFLLENEAEFKKEADLSKEDFVRTIEAFDHFPELGFTGGILSVDGKTVGISAGEVSGDTLFVHIEKALHSYSGAYPFLASLYAKQNARDGLLYINREDDSGDPGLRHSKLEYRPCSIINKYVVRYQ